MKFDCHHENLDSNENELLTIEIILYTVGTNLHGYITSL